MRAMIELRAGGYRGQEEGHAVVVEGGAPLSHGRVDGIKDVISIADSWFFVGNSRGS